MGKSKAIGCREAKEPIRDALKIREVTELAVTTRTHFWLVMNIRLIVEASLEPQLWRSPFDTKSYVKILRALKKLTSSLKLTLRYDTQLFSISPTIDSRIRYSVLQWRSGREDDVLLRTVSTISVLAHEPFAPPERTAQLLAVRVGLRDM